jgi:hypothetical protein
VSAQAIEIVGTCVKYYITHIYRIDGDTRRVKEVAAESGRIET